jgi:tetratricopeptide (TPR) repeat protein
VSSILDRHRERFLANPGDRRAFEALEEAHFVAGDWNGLVGLYERRLEARDLAGREQARVWFRLGQVLEERRGDAARAADCWRRALAADPTCRAALAGLRRQHAGRGQWDVVLQIADVEIGLDMPSGERAELLAEVGQVWLAQLQDAEQALLHFQRALEHEPLHPHALEGAARASHRLGRPREAAALWERRAAGCRGPERAAALVAQAGLLAGALGDAPRAAEVYRRALTEDPRNRDALEALAAIAEADRQWGLLAELDERRFEAAGTPEGRAGVALAAGLVRHRHLGDLEAARVWLRRAAAEGTRDPFVYRALADLERERGNDGALREALERQVEFALGPPGRGALVELAALHADAGADAQAVALLRQALAEDPDDALVLDALSDSLTRLGRWSELAECLERRAELAARDPSARASALAELAALQEEQLGDPDSARANYERALAADASCPGVSGVLERLYRKLEDWSALRQLLERTGHHGRREERPAALCALGELLLDRFDDRDGAARAFDAALGLDPGWAAAHRGRQRLATGSGDPDAILAAYAAEAAVSHERGRVAFLAGELAHRLEERGELAQAAAWVERWIEASPEDVDSLQTAARVYQALGRERELLAALLRLDPLLPAAQQAANRRRTAALHAEQGRREDAIAAYRAALEVEPHDVESLAVLAELLEPANRPEELAQTRRRLAELLDGPPRARCLDALAHLLEERLGDLPGAVDALERLAGTQGAPDDVEARLESLLERAARFDALAERLADRAERTSGEAARALRLRRARLLLEELSRFEEASAEYRRVLGEAPDCDEARTGLERSLRAAGDVPALAAFLGELADGHPDPATRDRCRLERAVMFEEALGDVGQAADGYRRLAGGAHQAAVRHAAAARLEALYERAGDWDELRRHWESQLEAEGADRAELHERLSRLCRDRLADFEAARLHLEAAAALAPARAELWQALAALHEQAGDFDALVRALEAELESRPERERELALHARAGALCLRQLSDPERARRHYQRVHELDPADAAASEFLIGFWQEHGRPDQVVALLEARLARAEGGPREERGANAALRASLRLRIASLRAGELGDPEAATLVLEPALLEVGPVAAVAEPLADLYRRTERDEALIDLCSRAAAHAEPGAERGGWLARLAEALGRLAREREAADAWRRALAERPDDPQAKASLRDLYRRLGEAVPLSRLLEAELSSLTGAGEVPARLELAKLYAGPLGRPLDALAQLRRVVQLDPGHHDALDEGLELAEHLGRSEVVRELLEAALDRPLPGSERARLLTRRGRLLAAAPERTHEAAADYREALALDPTRDEVREALRELFEATGQWEAALDCLFQQACKAAPPRRAALLERGAELAHQRIGPDAALPWLERLRRARPGDARIPARIAEIHRLAGRPRAQLRALEDQLALGLDPIAAREVQSERARVLERELDMPARAAAALEEARRLAPHEVSVLESLDRLYRGLARPRERAGVLEALAEMARGRDRVTLLCEAATLHWEALADPRGAGVHLRRALAEATPGTPLHAQLLQHLGGALRAAGDAEAWASCAEAELAALDPAAPVFAERRRELHLELARHHQRAERLDTALRHWVALVDGAEDEPDDEAEAALLSLLRRLGNRIEFERRLSARLSRHGGEAADWLELARLRDEHLASPARAVVAYRGALEMEPACLPALRGLRSAVERLGDFEAVADALEAELEHPAATVGEGRAAVLRRLGDVCWRHLGSTTRASRAYAAAIETHPEDFVAHRALQQLLEAMEDWRGAADLYESETSVLGERDPERRQAAWLRAGEIARDHLRDAERALRAYARAAAIGPLPAPRLAELAELQLRCGDAEAFTEVFGEWCDHPASGARAADHLRLAEALEGIGRLDAALARTRRAVELAADEPRAWDVSARLLEAQGAPGAGEAFERAAELTRGDAAAARWRRAAELCAAADPERAARLLRRASEADPASTAVQAELAAVALRLGAHQEAERAATRALDLDDAAAAAARLPAAVRLETALAGARAARSAGHPEPAVRCYEAALALAPDHAEALAGAGQLLCRLGDLAAARPRLEARLALPGPDPDAAVHRALLAQCLERVDPARALAECEAALAAEPTLDEAHEVCVRLHETAGNAGAGVAALERWAAAAPPRERGEILLRAARWERRTPGAGAGAERHLRGAVLADPALAAAWVELASLLWERGRAADALEAAERGLEHTEGDAPARSELALLRGRALEAGGRRGEAAQAYAAACAADPRCTEAAVAQARVLRAAGNWRGAADALASFVSRHPGGDPRAVSEALEQLGRLLAGPLEDLAAATDAYRRALALDPDRLELRAALAALLSQHPATRREALAEHARVLARDPTLVPTLRAVLRIARESGDARAEADGLCLLRALGATTPDETAQATAGLSFPISGAGALRDPRGEALRRAVQLAEREIAEALGAPATPAALAPGEGSDAAFRAEALRAEAELAAPGLLPLPASELADLLRALVALARETEPVSVSGATLNALGGSFGRRARRRVRRELEEAGLVDLQGFDFAGWRCDLRSLAAAVALERGAGDLRTALVVLACESADQSAREIGETADVSALVSASPEARGLFSRAVALWLEEIRT